METELIESNWSDCTEKTYHLIILGQAVLVLTNALSDDDRDVRTQTVSILSQMGPEATTRTMTKK